MSSSPAARLCADATLHCSVLCSKMFVYDLFVPRRRPRLFAADTTLPESGNARDLRCAGGRWWHQRRGHRPRCGGPWPVGMPVRARRPRLAYLQRQHQADPRRAALPGAVRVRAGRQGAGRARSAAAPGPAHHLAAALPAAASAAPAPGVDDPHRPVPVRPSRPRPPHPAGVQAHGAALGSGRRSVARGIPHRLRLFRRLGAGRAAGGAQCDGCSATRRADPDPHPLRGRAPRRRRLAGAAGACRRPPPGPAGACASQCCRAVGGAVPGRRGQGRPRPRAAPGQGQPHRGAAAVRARPCLHLPAAGPAHRVCHSLRARLHLDRHHRRGLPRRSVRAEDRCRGDALPVRGGQPLLPQADRARRRGVEL